MAFKFGRQQLGKPTPASIGFKITIISVICPVIILWLTTATYIPNIVSNITSSILSLIVALANVLKPFFGVNVEENSIPTEDVKEVEDKPVINNN